MITFKELKKITDKCGFEIREGSFYPNGGEVFKYEVENIRYKQDKESKRRRTFYAKNIEEILLKLILDATTLYKYIDLIDKADY